MLPAEKVSQLSPSLACLINALKSEKTEEKKPGKSRGAKVQDMSSQCPEEQTEMEEGKLPLSTVRSKALKHKVKSRV